MPHPFSNAIARRSTARCRPSPNAATGARSRNRRARKFTAKARLKRAKPRSTHCWENRFRSSSPALSAPSAAKHRRTALRSASAIRRPTWTISSRRSKRRKVLAQRRPGSMGRRVPGDPPSDQQAELSHRPRRHAHDGAGVHDGVPGRRTACAGPRPRGHRLRVGRDAADPGQGAVGKAAGQERAAEDGKAISASCRAASVS